MTFGHTIVVFQVAWVVKLLFLTEGQTRNLNTLLYDQIVETLFSCYDDSPLHFLKFFKLFKCFILVFH